jgi:hypothetical protein
MTIHPPNVLRQRYWRCVGLFKGFGEKVPRQDLDKAMLALKLETRQKADLSQKGAFFGEGGLGHDREDQQPTEGRAAGHVGKRKKIIRVGREAKYAICVVERTPSQHAAKRLSIVGVVQARCPTRRDLPA